MKRILVVDDDQDIREALGSLLEDTYEVALAKDGKIALDLIERQNFDAVVLDLMMPVMNGAELMRSLKHRGIALPVVLASASTNLGTQATELGAADFISKPFDCQDLETKLARALLGFGPKGGGGSDPSGSKGERQVGVEKSKRGSANSPGGSFRLHDAGPSDWADWRVSRLLPN